MTSSDYHSQQDALIEIKNQRKCAAAARGIGGAIE